MNNRVHIAIMDDKTIQKIRSNIKTIETRFSKTRIPPYESVSNGDVVLLKKSGGEIKGAFFVEKVQYFHNFEIDKLKMEYGKDISAPDEYWKQKGESKYGSLIWCENPVVGNIGVGIKHRGQSGWLIVPISNSPIILCFSGEIGAGKTTYAKSIAKKINAAYVNFGTVIAEYARNKGMGFERTDLQNIGQRSIADKGGKEILKMAAAHYGLSTDIGMNMVFDGVRHIEVLQAIREVYGDATLVFVQSSEFERLERYNRREQANISLEEFRRICDMSVEKEISSLRDCSTYIINNHNDSRFTETVENVCNILFCLITGTSPSAHTILNDHDKPYSYS